MSRLDSFLIQQTDSGEGVELRNVSETTTLLDFVKGFSVIRDALVGQKFNKFCGHESAQ